MSRRSRFASETVRKPAVKKRQLRFVEYFVRVITAERDFRRRDETGTFVFDAVDVRFVSARVEADALKHFLLCDIGRHKGRKPVLSQNAERIHDKRLFEKNRFVFEIIEFWAGNLRSALEVDDIERFSERYVIFRRERKNARRADFFYFEVFRIDFADRSLRVRHIRDFPRSFFELRFRFR